MRAAKIQVILWFFVIVSIVGVYKYITAKSDLQLLAQTGVKDEVLAFIRQQNADLLADKTTLQREEIALKLLQLKKYPEKARLDIERVKLYADTYLYGLVFLIGCTGLSCIIVVTGIHREKVKRASVHTYKIGQSEIIVHEKDLAMAAPIAMGLVNAEIAGKTTDGIKTVVEICRDIQAVQHPKFSAMAQAALPETGVNGVIDLPARPPTFRDLLNDGTIQRGKPIVFGHDLDTQALFAGTWDDLFSCAVGGQQGSGKTSTLRSIICQSLLQGYKVWVIDPHYPHPKSLLHSLKPFLNAGLIFAGTATETLKEVNQTITHRLSTQESSDNPAILVIDEVLDVVNGCRGATETISRIGTQGRKCQVFGLFAGHSWLASRTGGDSAVRDNLTARIVHHMERKQAYILLQDTELAKEAKTLKTGEAYFQTIGRTPARVHIPKCEPADVFEVAELLKTANGQNVSSETFLPVDKCRILGVDKIESAEIQPPSNVVKFQRVEKTDVNGKSTAIQPVDKKNEETQKIIEKIRKEINEKRTTLGEISRQTKVDKAWLSKIINGGKVELMSDNLRKKLSEVKYESTDV
jgi:GTPase SAR1 family protein